DDLVVGARGMGALGAGVPSSGSAPATIPTTTPFGTYFLLACADDLSQIVEANEANNCRAASGTIVVGPPSADLIVTAVSAPPATVAASASFAVTDTTQNVGATGSAPASSTRYYLSSNTLRDAGDILLTGARAVPALVAGASSAGTVTVTIPATTPVGTYFVLACADDTAQVPETNETNNCGASASTVQVTPATADLAVTGLDDPSATGLVGGTFRATDITRNIGVVAAGASTTRYYLSLDTVRDANDVLLGGSRAVPALGPGAFSTDTVTVTIPTGTPAGRYSLRACPDDRGAVHHPRRHGVRHLLPARLRRRHEPDHRGERDEQLPRRRRHDHDRVLITWGASKGPPCPPWCSGRPGKAVAPLSIRAPHGPPN